MENRLSLLDQVRSIAQLGLHYANNPYDRDRYEMLLDLTSKEYSKISDIKESIVKERFIQELGHLHQRLV